jgi:uncharacterized protein
MLLDTSGLLCYFDRRDPRYSAARDFFAAAPTRLLHSYVLAEVFPLYQSRGMARQVTLQFVAELLSSPDVEMVWVDGDLGKTAWAFLQQHRDKLYSLCDAVSFLLMYERGLTEALTTDHHFEQAGFRRLLPP